MKAIWQWWLQKRRIAKFNKARKLLRGSGYSIVRILQKGGTRYIEDVDGTIHRIGRR